MRVGGRSAAGPAGPVSTAPPFVAGSLVDGATLTANPGGWSGTPTITIAFQWQRCDADGTNCADLPGETGRGFDDDDGLAHPHRSAHHCEAELARVLGYRFSAKWVFLKDDVLSECRRLTKNMKIQKTLQLPYDKAPAC